MVGQVPPTSPFASLDPARQRIAFAKAQERINEIRETVPAALSAIELEIARRRVSTLKGFVETFWSEVEPDMPLSWNWHLDELCQVLSELERGDYLKVAINVPPGTMKSLLISVFFRAYIWSKAPGKRFLNGSYNGNLTIRDNVKLRKIVTSARYQQLFPKVVLTSDQNVKEKFETTEGGYSIATSVGGTGTGEHPDYAIIDDPLSEQQSRSDVERASANAWIDKTLSTRGITRDMRTILIMQRLHEEDCTGHVLAKGGWQHVCFPMRYEKEQKQSDGSTRLADKRDRRRAAGELLWKELFPEHKVIALEIQLGLYSAAGQLQQRPAPEGGGLFRREWFKFVTAAPVVARRARGWDTAATEADTTKKEPDWTVGVRIAEPPSQSEPGEGAGTFFIEHVFREQLSPHGVDVAIRTIAQSDGIGCAQREEREGGGSGKTVTSARAKMMKGFDYAEVIVSRDKVTRSRPLRAQVQAGNVYIVRSGDPVVDAWIEPYLAELCVFPNGAKDDQVDGSSCSFNAVLLEPVPQEEFVSW